MVLTVLIAGGNVVWGACVAGDGNDTRDDATPISFNETVSDWVCPDDPFDYYKLIIPDGMVVTGNINFSGKGAGIAVLMEAAMYMPL